MLDGVENGRLNVAFYDEVLCIYHDIVISTGGMPIRASFQLLISRLGVENCEALRP
jgi:hypothetical protein